MGSEKTGEHVRRNYSQEVSVPDFKSGPEMSNCADCHAIEAQMQTPMFSQTTLLL